MAVVTDIETPDRWKFTGQDRRDWPVWMKTHPSTAYHIGPHGIDIITFDVPGGTCVARLGDTLYLASYGELSIDRADAPSGRIYPDDWTPQLHHVLGLMNFQTVPVAHALRAGGEKIPSKTEEEQAYVLHWMIKLALDHPEDWSKRVADRLEEVAAAARKAGDAT